MKSYLKLFHFILLASSLSALSELPLDVDESMIPNVNADIKLFNEFSPLRGLLIVNPIEFWKHGQTPPPDKYGRYLLRHFTDSDRGFFGKSFSMIVWTKIDVDQRPERALLGIKGRKGDFVLLGIDKEGVPEWTFRDAAGMKTTVSATAGRSSLNDGKWHCLIAICDRNIGLVRLYLDSRPEAAKALCHFEMSETESVLSFQCNDLAGFSRKNHFRPRILDRELSELDILQFPSVDFFAARYGLISLPSFSARFQKLITETAIIFAAPCEKRAAGRIRIIRRTYDR